MGRPRKRLAVDRRTREDGLGLGPSQALQGRDSTPPSAGQPEEVALKLCRGCQLLVPMTAFYTSNRERDKLVARCIDCERDRARRYYAANAARVSLRMARARAHRFAKSKWNPLGLSPKERT